jgi:hypothetical protein
MNERQTVGIFQSNRERLVMAVNCEFLPQDTGRWEFTREWVTKSA